MCEDWRQDRWDEHTHLCRQQLRPATKRHGDVGMISTEDPLTDIYSLQVQGVGLGVLSLRANGEHEHQEISQQQYTNPAWGGSAKAN